MKQILATLAFAGTTFGLLAAPLAHADDESVTAKQMIDAINVAQQQSPGRITEIDVERKRGRTVIEIENIDANGREGKVYVDPETGKTVR